MFSLRRPIFVFLFIAFLVGLWLSRRVPFQNVAAPVSPIAAHETPPVDTGPPPPMGISNDRLPAAVVAKISRWSPEPSVAVSEGSAASMESIATVSTKPGDLTTPPPSPFPEPKKVLTPEELEKGQW